MGQSAADKRAILLAFKVLDMAEELIEKVWPAPVGKPELGGLGNSTMACCEEGPDNCC